MIAMAEEKVKKLHRIRKNLNIKSKLQLKLLIVILVLL